MNTSRLTNKEHRIYIYLKDLEKIQPQICKSNQNFKTSKDEINPPLSFEKNNNCGNCKTERISNINDYCFSCEIQDFTKEQLKIVENQYTHSNNKVLFIEKQIVEADERIQNLLLPSYQSDGFCYDWNKLFHSWKKINEFCNSKINVAKSENKIDIPKDEIKFDHLIFIDQESYNLFLLLVDEYAVNFRVKQFSQIYHWLIENGNRIKPNTGAKYQEHVKVNFPLMTAKFSRIEDKKPYEMTTLTDVFKRFSHNK